MVCARINRDDVSLPSRLIIPVELGLNNAPIDLVTATCRSRENKTFGFKNRQARLERYATSAIGTVIEL